jgi:hypothetical protein
MMLLDLALNPRGWASGCRCDDHGHGKKRRLWPVYPLATYGGLRQESAGKAHEFVFRNRLVRVVDEKERAEFVKDPAKLRRGSCTRDSRRILDFPLDLVGNYKP